MSEKEEDKKEVLYIVMPENGSLLNDDQLNILINLLETKMCITNVTIENQMLLFKNVEDIDELIDELNYKIKEKFILIQSPSYGPAIRHRVFNFKNINGLVEVRFFNINSKYNFDFAINYLLNL